MSAPSEVIVQRSKIDKESTNYNALRVYTKEDSTSTELKKAIRHIRIPNEETKLLQGAQREVMKRATPILFKYLSSIGIKYSQTMTLVDANNVGNAHLGAGSHIDWEGRIQVDVDTASMDSLRDGMPAFNTAQHLSHEEFHKEFLGQAAITKGNVPLNWVNEAAARIKSLEYASPHVIEAYFNNLSEDEAYHTGVAPSKEFASSLFMSLAGAAYLGISPEEVFSYTIRKYGNFTNSLTGSENPVEYESKYLQFIKQHIIKRAQENGRLKPTFFSLKTKESQIDSELYEYGKRFVLKNTLKQQLTRYVFASCKKQIIEEFPA